MNIRQRGKWKKRKTSTNELGSIRLAHSDLGEAFHLGPDDIDPTFVGGIQLQDTLPHDLRTEELTGDSEDCGGFPCPRRSVEQEMWQLGWNVGMLGNEEEKYVRKRRQWGRRTRERERGLTLSLSRVFLSIWTTSS